VPQLATAGLSTSTLSLPSRIAIRN
jgi:hypothetical protein